MSHQDWNEVTLSKTRGPRTAGQKNAAQASAIRSGAGVATEKKWAAGENKSSHHGHLNMRKLDDETEELKHNRVDRSLCKAIQQARLAKKISQKQLATSINEKPQVVGEYESGKAIPNPQIIVKLERALGTRLPRPGKGAKK
ncbi:unnamed protein product [Chrysoparadoxa australica]